LAITIYYKLYRYYK